MEAAPSPTGSPSQGMAAVKRGLKRSLRSRARTVLLMLDETIITEIPSLYCCYGHIYICETVRVPITGNRSKRFLHGAINIIIDCDSPSAPGATTDRTISPTSGYRERSPIPSVDCPKRSEEGRSIVSPPALQDWRFLLSGAHQNRSLRSHRRNRPRLGVVVQPVPPQTPQIILCSRKKVLSCF